MKKEVKRREGFRGETILFRLLCGMPVFLLVFIAIFLIKRRGIVLPRQSLPTPVVLEDTQDPESVPRPPLDLVKSLPINPVSTVLEGTPIVYQLPLRAIGAVLALFHGM